MGVVILYLIVAHRGDSQLNSSCLKSSETCASLHFCVRVSVMTLQECCWPGCRGDRASYWLRNVIRIRFIFRMDFPRDVSTHFSESATFGGNVRIHSRFSLSKAHQKHQWRSVAYAIILQSYTK